MMQDRRKYMFYISIIFTIIFLVVWGKIFYSNVNYAFDAYNYTMLADSFIENGRFSFWHYPVSIRGYVLPFIYLIIKTLGGLFGVGQNTSIQIVQSIAFVLACILLFPKFLTKERKRQYDLRYLIVIILAFVWWKDLIYWALSDLWALYFLLLGTVCLDKVSFENGIKVKNCILALLSGCFMYLSYNTRTIYLFACIAIVCVYFFKSIKKQQNMLQVSVIFIINVLGGGDCGRSANYN